MRLRPLAAFLSDYGNAVPDGYLRKLYGPNHWINAPDEESAPETMPDALSDFVREQL